MRLTALISGAVALTVVVAGCGAPSERAAVATTMTASATRALAPLPARRTAPARAPVVVTTVASTTVASAPVASPAVASTAAVTTTATVATRSATLDDLAPAAVRQPVGLRVPAIGVDTGVVPVGVDGAGAFELPEADVGWYRYGPAPGDEGSSVLAGHVDFDGREGALFRLHEARLGDEVVVSFADGTSGRFEVVAVEQYRKEQLPTDALFDRAGDARLAIITCGGEFDRAARHYRDNVVVHARPAP